MDISEADIWRKAYEYSDRLAEGADCVRADTFQDIQALLMEAFVAGVKYAENNP